MHLNFLVFGELNRRLAATCPRIELLTFRIYLLEILGVCVCVMSSHLFWTSNLWTHQRVIQEEGHKRTSPASFCGAIIDCLNLLSSREGFSRSFPSSTVKSNFVYLLINRSPLVGHFFFLTFYCEKYQFVLGQVLWTEVRTHIPTSKGFRGYHTN